MIKWFLDKENKMPLYLQLKDLIKYYIATGAIKDNDRLPGIISLARELKISFETTRKAYKELEKEGLLSVNRGKGSFATLRYQAPSQKPAENHKQAVRLVPETELKNIMTRLLQEGRNEKEVRALLESTLKEAVGEVSTRFIIFTECSLPQTREISRALEKELNVKVRPVLVSDLKEEIEKIRDFEHRLLAVVTTGFHLNEVRKIIADRPLDIHILITHMSPETWRKLASLNKDTRLGFICRDRETITLYVDLLKTELGEQINLLTCVLEEKARMKEIINSVDVLLVTPTAYETVRKMASKKLPVFNVFDRIDPMTLKIIESSIARKLESAVVG